MPALRCSKCETDWPADYTLYRLCPGCGISTDYQAMKRPLTDPEAQERLEQLRALRAAVNDEKCQPGAYVTRVSDHSLWMVVLRDEDGGFVELEDAHSTLSDVGGRSAIFINRRREFTCDDIVGGFKLVRAAPGPAVIPDHLEEQMADVAAGASPDEPVYTD